MAAVDPAVRRTGKTVGVCSPTGLPLLRRIFILGWSVLPLRWRPEARTPTRLAVKEPLLGTRFSGLAATALAACIGFGQAVAAAETYIRDTEIEADIRTMVTPIWKAAGLDPNALHVYLVEDNQINSFVAGGQNEFINTGLVMRAKTPNQLIGVLAHETNE